MKYKLKSIAYITAALMLVSVVGCKKGTFDVNSPNPNTPSSVDPKFILPAAMTNLASLCTGSNNDILDNMMGYWSVSGDYSPNAALATMTLNSDLGAGFWNSTYPIVQNLKNIETYYGTAATGNYYVAISKVLKSYLFSRLVDMYNNIPYSDAANGGTNSFPAYDDAQTVYKSCISQLDSAITLINTAGSTAANPGSSDAMYGGTMTKWVTFANTLKLKMLLKFTTVTGGTAYISSKISGLTSASFIGANADASINPGYINDASGHQNPLWDDIGYSSSGSPYGDNAYYRATTYAVNFYKNTNDPRLPLFYTPINGLVVGRAFGSQLGTEHNATISGIGGNATGATQTSGVLKSATQGSVILSSAESFFLQAQAAQANIIAGTSYQSLYQSAVSESFRLLGVANYATAAATYTAQSGDNVNITTSSNPVKTIITQKWAALNTYDPLESWSDWRRLGIPADLPIPIYQGTTITHMPYRLLYASSEYLYNTANVNAQGTITQNNKIFWMP